MVMSMKKWFLMEDREGLRGAGSLNESRQALKLNAENIDVNCSWEGGRESQRIDQARKDFDRLWGNKNPHMKVLPLPQAVREKLVKLRNLKGKLMVQVRLNVIKLWSRVLRNC